MTRYEATRIVSLIEKLVDEKVALNNACSRGLPYAEELGDVELAREELITEFLTVGPSS